jgi:hypothetical protein
LLFYLDTKKWTRADLEEIKSSGGSTIAIVVRKDFNKEGINFFSEDVSPIQLGVNTYKKGHKINGHFHPKREVVINTFQEVIYLKRGKVVVELFDFNRKFVKSISLSGGDLIFFVDGGHGFEMSEDTTFIEVKQGPYLGKDKDKELIE